MHDLYLPDADRNFIIILNAYKSTHLINDADGCKSVIASIYFQWIAAQINIVFMKKAILASESALDVFIIHLP